MPEEPPRAEHGAALLTGSEAAVDGLVVRAVAPGDQFAADGTLVAQGAVGVTHGRQLVPPRPTPWRQAGGQEAAPGQPTASTATTHHAPDGSPIHHQKENRKFRTDKLVK